MLAALGIAGANVIWLLLAASGAAALAEQFPRAFLTLKILGVVVILYLALTTMFGPLPNAEADAGKAPPRKKLFSKGVALQLSSPLPLVYFGLLLPTYFDLTRSLPVQFGIMLATVTATELIGLAVYAFGAQKIRDWLRAPKQARAFNLAIGVVMIASGIWAILSTT